MLDGLADLYRIQRVKDESARRLIDKRWMIADARCNHRASGNESLADHVRQALIQRWMYQRPMLAQKIHDVPPLAKPVPLRPHSGILVEDRSEGGNVALSSRKNVLLACP